MRSAMPRGMGAHLSSNVNPGSRRLVSELSHITHQWAGEERWRRLRSAPFILIERGQSGDDCHQQQCDHHSEEKTDKVTFAV